MARSADYVCVGCGCPEYRHTDYPDVCPACARYLSDRDESIFDDSWGDYENFSEDYHP